MGRKYRFFTNVLKDENLGREIILTPANETEIVEQLTKVLRVKKDDEVVLLPSRREPPYIEFIYSVESADRKSIRLNLIAESDNHNEAGRRIGLILCMPNKPEKLSFILQKAVELGVSGVTLARSDNSQMKHEIKTERLRRIMKEAAEQSERAFVPYLNFAGNLTDYLDGLRENELKKVTVALERSENLSVLKMKSGASAEILIGPEGGFSEREREFFEAKKMTTFSLGKRILRMETAAVLALGIMTMED